MRRRRTALTIAALGALALAACDDDDSRSDLDGPGLTDSLGLSPPQVINSTIQ